MEFNLNLEENFIDFLENSLDLYHVADEFGNHNPEIADIATAIYDKNEPYGIKNRLAAEILNQFSEIIKAPDNKAVIDEYRARSIIIGKEVNIIENGEVKSATVVDIDDTAAIILKTDDGKIIKKTSGEISIKVK